MARCVPPCVRIVVASLKSELGAATKDRNGKVRTEIHGQSGSPITSSGKCGTGGRCTRSWDWCRNTATLAGEGAVQAVIVVAALDEAGKSAWCCEHGVFPTELDAWRASATTALAEPEELRASPQATRQDRKRIKELERELLRKDRALAETAALLVLSKKVAAIFNKGEAE